MSKVVLTAISAVLILVVLLYGAYTYGLLRGIDRSAPYREFYRCLINGIQDNKVPLGQCNSELTSKLQQ